MLRIATVILLGSLASQTSAVNFSNCSIESGDAGLRDAQCTRLEVPLDHQHPSGQKLSLHVVRLQAFGKARPDPVFFLAGGPGQGASESFVQLEPFFHKIRMKRDIILVDQRGTGKSGALHCEEPEDVMAMEDDPAAIAAWLEECRQQYTGLEHYGSWDAMQDLDFVRETLAYEQINLYGVSYGTRAASVYMRYFPERVRTAILDGVVPPAEALGSSHARNLDQALIRIFASCSQNPSCQQAFPDPAGNLASLVESLENNPLQLSLEHPRSGELTDLKLDHRLLAMVVRMYSYSPETAALLPLLLHHAVNTGDFEKIGAQALYIMDKMKGMIARAMEMSVVCNEDIPRYPAIPENPARSLLGNAFSDHLKENCRDWPRKSLPEGFHEPLDSSIPTLLLSGEFDPVTPPAFAEQMLDGLHNAQHWVVPEAGHLVFNRGCVAKLAGKFLSQAGFENIDTACIDSISSPAFFLDFSGGQP